MTSTRHRSRKEFLQKTPSDGLEELRLAFHARLQSDRVHFATLSAALARAEESPGWIFQDLQFRAHKIRGGAAIFEIAAVEAAAFALEQAAICAAQSNANNTDVRVWASLEALVSLMGALDAEVAPAQLPGPDHLLNTGAAKSLER
jgi:HPt (histidine-containing phosphotransfer) domain-containing protein